MKKVSGKSETRKGGRRAEMNVLLGLPTIKRWRELYVDGDYAIIAEEANPKTTRQTVSKHINAASLKPETWKMPLSVAQALQAFYLRKEKAQASVSA